MNEAKGQLPSQTSAEFVHAYHAQSREIIDAITAVVMNSEAGLNWLHAEPPDLEEVRRTLNDIVSDCKRAAEIVVRLHALMRNVPTADGTVDP